MVSLLVHELEHKNKFTTMDKLTLFKKAVGEEYTSVPENHK